MLLWCNARGTLLLCRFALPHPLADSPKCPNHLCFHHMRNFCRNYLCFHHLQKTGGGGYLYTNCLRITLGRRADILSLITYCGKGGNSIRSWDWEVGASPGQTRQQDQDRIACLRNAPPQRVLPRRFGTLGVGVSFFPPLSLLKRDCCHFPVFWRRRGHRRNFRTRSRRAWHRRISGW